MHILPRYEPKQVWHRDQNMTASIHYLSQGGKPSAWSFEFQQWNGRRCLLLEVSEDIACSKRFEKHPMTSCTKNCLWRLESSKHRWKSVSDKLPGCKETTDTFVPSSLQWEIAQLASWHVTEPDSKCPGANYHAEFAESTFKLLSRPREKAPSQVSRRLSFYTWRNMKIK